MQYLIVLPADGSGSSADWLAGLGLSLIPVDGVVAAPVAAAGGLGAVWRSMIGLL
jgi:hypothetical protein